MSNGIQSSANPDDFFAEVSFEQAYALAEEIPDAVIKETAETKVVSGTHPTRGAIYIVIPSFGNSMVLKSYVKPVVFRDLEA
ncbi:hypothetical protein [Aureimonas sp. AU40]|uniref:hypothetical protein n=1 Tax=Aureimonas sp. AU40 TaxID=1637747 RepID=UPI000B105D30|nr:hypothetical protein [Aureimonas sp. AU40]